MPITCQQCGRQNPDGATFCVNRECGAYLDWESQRLRRPAPDPVAGPRPPGPPDPRADAGEQRAGARIAVAERNLAVEPGGTITTTVTVHNSGTRVENFRLVVQGPVASWATLEPASVSVYPGSEAKSTLRFAPPRSAAAQAGQAWYTVQAMSTVHPGLVENVNGMLEVAPFRGLDAELTPRTTRGRFGTVHTVRVTNQGNVVEPVTVSASDPESLLRFDLPAGEIRIRPGVQQIGLLVRAPLRLTGQPRTYPFQAVVTPRPPLPPLRLDGSRETVVLAPFWVLITAAAVLLIAVLSPFVPRLLSVVGGEPSQIQQPAVLPQAPGATTEEQRAAPAEQRTTAPPAPTRDQPAPPQPPSVHAQGELEIPVTHRADLDEGTVTDEEGDERADLLFGGDTEAERFIGPVNGARLAPAGAGAPSFQQCANARLADDPVPIEALTSPFLCVRTSEDRVSVVRIDGLSGSDSDTLNITFATLAP